MRKILIVLSYIFLFTSAYAQDVNYCQDEQSWEEWNQLVLKYPNDRDVQILHAVRIGLCRKIEAGTILFEVARDAFNHMHQMVVKRAKQEEKQYLENRQL